MKIQSVNIPNFEDFAGKDLHDQLLNKLSLALEIMDQCKECVTIEKKNSGNTSYTYYHLMSIELGNPDYPHRKETILSVSLTLHTKAVFEMNYRQVKLKRDTYSAKLEIKSEEFISFAGDKEKDKLYLDKFKDTYKQVAVSCLEDL